MRAVWAGLTAVGAVALVATVAVDLARGDPAGAGWMLAGPGPFWAAGVIGAWRQPGRRAWLWLLAAGAFFLVLLLNTAAAAPDRQQLLRSLAVTFGAAFVLPKHLDRAS
jgi:hypothetical protein